MSAPPPDESVNARIGIAEKEHQQDNISKAKG